MDYLPYIGLAIALAFVIGLAIVWGRRSRPVSPALAKGAFGAQRENLERAFFEAAANSGSPRGLIWKSCEFGAEPTFARHKPTGEIHCLLPVTIAFEAVPGSDMEGLPAVSNLRSATATFAYRKRSWSTSGRVLFNMDPAEALRRFQDQYIALAE